MKKRILVKPNLVRLFLVPLAANLVFPSKFNKTPAIEQLLHENQIVFETQLQAPPSSGNFPKDIIVKIPAKDNLKSSPSSSIACAGLLIDQEFFANNCEFFLRLIDTARGCRLPYDLLLILPASEATSLPQQRPPRYAHISLLLPSPTTDQQVCALIVKQAQEDTAVISTQAGGKVCPQWLAQAVHRACSQNAKPVKLEHRAHYFHKSGIYKESPLLTHFLQEEIPSLQITLAGVDSDLAVLSSFLETLATAKTHNTSYRYAFVDTWPSFWINEAQLIFILIVFSALVLLFVCFISFSSSSKNEAFFKDVARSWFVPLSHLVLCAASLSLFQMVFSAHQGSEILLFGFKLVPTLFVMFLLIFVQTIFDFRLSLAANRFNTTIFCAFNVVFFSSIDLQLMPLFIAEFLIVCLFSLQRNFFLTVFCVASMIFPFSRTFMSIFRDVQRDKIASALIHATFAENLCLSLLILPFLFQWTKLLLLFTRKLSASSKKTRFLRGFLLSTFAALFTVFLFISFALPLAKTLPPPEQQKPITQVDQSDTLFRTTASTSSNFDLERCEIRLMPAEGVSFLRCNIEVSSSAQSPILECNFSFTLYERGHVTIEIPDYPLGDVCVVLCWPMDFPPHINVSVFASDDAGAFFFAEQSFGVADETQSEVSDGL